MNTVCCGKCGSLNIVSTTNGGYYCIDCKNFFTDVGTNSPVGTYSINNNILTIDVDSVVLKKDTLTITLDRVNIDNLRAIEIKINGVTSCKER